MKKKNFTPSEQNTSKELAFECLTMYQIQDITEILSNE